MTEFPIRDYRRLDPLSEFYKGTEWRWSEGHWIPEEMVYGPTVFPAYYDAPTNHLAWDAWASGVGDEISLTYLGLVLETRGGAETAAGVSSRWSPVFSTGWFFINANPHYEYSNQAVSQAITDSPDTFVLKKLPKPGTPITVEILAYDTERGIIPHKRWSIGDTNPSLSLTFTPTGTKHRETIVGQKTGNVFGFTLTATPEQEMPIRFSRPDLFRTQIPGVVGAPAAQGEWSIWSDYLRVFDSQIMPAGDSHGLGFIEYFTAFPGVLSAEYWWDNSYVDTPYELGQSDGTAWQVFHLPLFPVKDVEILVDGVPWHILDRTYDDEPHPNGKLVVDCDNGTIEFADGLSNHGDIPPTGAVITAYFVAVPMVTYEPEEAPDYAVATNLDLRAKNPVATSSFVLLGPVVSGESQAEASVASVELTTTGSLTPGALIKCTARVLDTWGRPITNAPVIFHEGIPEVIKPRQQRLGEFLQPALVTAADGRAVTYFAATSNLFDLAIIWNKYQRGEGSTPDGVPGAEIPTGIPRYTIDTNGINIYHSTYPEFQALKAGAGAPIFAVDTGDSYNRYNYIARTGGRIRYLGLGTVTQELTYTRIECTGLQGLLPTSLVQLIILPAISQLWASCGTINSPTIPIELALGSTTWVGPLVLDQAILDQFTYISTAAGGSW